MQENDKQVEPQAIDPQLQSWLLLSLLPGVGPKRFAQVLEHFDSPQSFLQLTPSSLGAFLAAKARSALRSWQAQQGDDYKFLCARLEEVQLWLADENHHLLSLESAAYPERLKHIYDPPPLLYVWGNLAALSEYQLAIVGSRKPSLQGLHNAAEFAAHLASRGLCITSGLAYGIDSAAHQGALKAEGMSIAVLGSGLKEIYPAKHSDLAKQLVHRGAVISEYPLHTPPRAANFPRRNRIVTGLSLGVLVVEAALPSGSLISAACALEQGREVMALPGSINSAQAQGCNQLIAEGACLVRDADEVLFNLGLDVPAPPCSSASEDSVEQDTDLEGSEGELLSYLSEVPMNIDCLQQHSGLAVAVLLASLQSLELKQRALKIAGGYIRAT